MTLLYYSLCLGTVNQQRNCSGNNKAFSPFLTFLADNIFSTFKEKSEEPQKFLHPRKCVEQREKDREDISTCKGQNKPQENVSKKGM